MKQVETYLVINANCEDIYSMFYDTGCHIWMNSEVYSSMKTAINTVLPNTTILLINEGNVYLPRIEYEDVTSVGTEIECTYEYICPIDIRTIPKCTKINLYDTCAKYMLKCSVINVDSESNCVWYYLDSVYDFDYMYKTAYSQEVMLTDEFGTPRDPNEPEKLLINLKFKEVYYNEF